MKINDRIKLGIWLSLITFQALANTVKAADVNTAKPLDIIYPVLRKGSELDQYALRLAKFLLAKSPTPVRFIAYNKVINSQQRKVLLLKQGVLSLDWLGSDDWIEQQVTAVPFPIFRGLLGHRIFIVNQQYEQQLRQVKTVQQLRQFSMVQGQGWGDTGILRSAQFNVKEIADFDTLFKLVEAGRIQLFPRAIFEPYGELAARPQLTQLTIDDTLMLVYKYPMFFYVSPTKANHKLAVLLTQSFQQAYQDGSFLQFFTQDPLIKKTLARVKMSQRITFVIDNPHLTGISKAIASQYWYFH